MREGAASLRLALPYFARTKNAGVVRRGDVASVVLVKTEGGILFLSLDLLIKSSLCRGIPAAG